MADKLVIEIQLEPEVDKSAFNKIDKTSKQAGQKAGKNFEVGFGSSVKKGLNGIKSSIASTFAGLAGFAAISSALRVGVTNLIEFEKGIAEINSILPKNQKLTEGAALAIQRFAASFGTEQSTQARAFYDIVSAGVKGTSNQLKVLAQANKAALAGLVSIDQAADVLVSSVNAYSASGLTAKEASDQLFIAVREGKTTFGELTNTLGNVTSIAASSGVKFSELAGAIGFVTKAGQSTDATVTGLRQVFVSVIKPTAEAADEAKRLGLEFNTAAIRSKGLAGFLKSVQKATGGSEASLAKLFGNVRALAPVLNIVNGNFEEFERILKGTSNAVGATDDAAKILGTTLSQDLATSASEIGIAFTNIASIVEPVFRELVTSARTVAREFNRLFGDKAVTEADKIRVAYRAIGKEIAFLQDQAKSENLGFRFKREAAIQKQIAKLEEKRAGQRRQLKDLRVKGEKETSEEVVNNSKAEGDKLVAVESNIATRLANIGLTKIETIRNQRAAQLAVITEAEEARFITESEAEARRLQVIQSTNAQIKQAYDEVALNTEFNFSNIGAALDALANKSKITSGQIAKAFVNGIGGAAASGFASFGKALASGENALDAFGKAFLQSIGQVLIQQGTAFILEGTAYAFSTRPDLQAKSAGLIGAGAAMATFGGLLGASASGGGAASAGGGGSSAAESGGDINSGALESQDIVQAEAKDNIQLVVQGSIFNTSETAKDLTKLLNENFESTGAALTNTRFA